MDMAGLSKVPPMARTSNVIDIAEYSGRRGEYTLLLVALPGRAEESAGVLLLDPERDDGHAIAAGERQFLFDLKQRDQIHDFKLLRNRAAAGKTRLARFHAILPIGKHQGCRVARGSNIRFSQ